MIPSQFDPNVPLEKRVRELLIGTLPASATIGELNLITQAVTGCINVWLMQHETTTPTHGGSTTPVASLRSNFLFEFERPKGGGE